MTKPKAYMYESIKLLTYVTYVDDHFYKVGYYKYNTHEYAKLRNGYNVVENYGSHSKQLFITLTIDG